MKLESTFEKNRVVVHARELTPLPWLASGLEYAALWFFGRGCFDLRLTRVPRAGGVCVEVVPVVPPGEPKPLNWSNFTTIATMRHHKLFPERLVARHRSKGGEETVIEHADMKPEATLGSIAYGLADVTLDMWLRGARVVRAQYSMQLSQTWADVGLSDKDLRDFADPDVADYAPGTHVGLLPWR